MKENIVSVLVSVFLAIEACCAAALTTVCFNWPFIGGMAVFGTLTVLATAAIISITKH